LKITVITAAYNSATTISSTIRSVAEQAYPDIEYIVIDGASSDGTQEIVRSFGNRITKFISEPDQGIYDAINKGIKLATGDIIGILNSDDVFYNNMVIARIAASFESENPDAVYGDVQFINKDGSVVRYYSSKRFYPEHFRFGFMPAHPSFYAKRELFEKFGCYMTDYRIAADYELLIRFLYTHRINAKYIEMPFVKMLRGGVSNRSVFSNILLNREILRACSENGIKTNYMNIYSKYFRKIFEYLGNKNYKFS
jgi:glycosyltransferase involved in cell wall biosynthesis